MECRQIWSVFLGCTAKGERFSWRCCFGFWFCGHFRVILAESSNSFAIAGEVRRAKVEDGPSPWPSPHGYDSTGSPQAWGEGRIMEEVPGAKVEWTRRILAGSVIFIVECGLRFFFIFFIWRWGRGCGFCLLWR